MDNFNQLGLNSIRKNTDAALRRKYPEDSVIERVRDIFDYVTFFEMDFRIPDYATRETLDLQFSPPPPNCCCTNCLCANCEYFSNDPNITTAYEFKVDTLKVFLNDAFTTNYTITGKKSILLGFSPVATDTIKVCYATEILINSTSTDCADCTDPFLNNIIGAGAVSIGRSGVDGGPKWAHSTDNTATDTDVSGIPYTSNNGCISISNATLRGAGTISVAISFGFSKPVKLCSVGWTGTSSSYVEVTVGTTTYITDYPGLQQLMTDGIPVTGIAFIFTQSAGIPGAGNLGPFGLWFFSGPTVCSFSFCTTGVECSYLLTNNLLPHA